jgi:hypothetical protein
LATRSQRAWSVMVVASAPTNLAGGMGRYT